MGRRSFDHHGKRNNFEKTKKMANLFVYLSLIPQAHSNENALVYEVACDCVKRANVAVAVKKEIFSKTHTDTLKPTSAQFLTVTTMTHIHLTRSLVAWSPAGLL